MRTVKLVLALAACTAPLFAQREAAPDAKPPQTLAARTAAMTHMPGLLPLDWDAKAGKLYLEIPLDADRAHSPDFLYTHALPYGTGSNDLGLDRGQTRRRPHRPLRAHRPQGPARRAQHTPSAQLRHRPRRAARRHPSFPALRPRPASHVEAEVARRRHRPRRRHRLLPPRRPRRRRSPRPRRAGRLPPRPHPLHHRPRRHQSLPQEHRSRSRAHLHHRRRRQRRRGAASSRDVTPDPHAMTVHEHQSFIELPAPGFTPRRFDPRAGYFPI